MESIRISIIQTDIAWENKQENLRLLHEKLQSLRGITEMVVLPGDVFHRIQHAE